MASLDDTLLSARERECLKMLAEGSRVKTISWTLDIQEVTVEMHLRNARQKLGAQTREQAIAIALTKGLIVMGE